MGGMNMFYIKPTLKNLSQGARLEYVREFRHMSKEDVVAYFEFGGDEPNKTIRSYESNVRHPSKIRLEELAKLYEVSINAIKEYDYSNSIDLIYNFMWLEEEFPYYEINFEEDKYKGTAYNLNVQKGIKEWEKMKDKRENLEISDDEYLEWKLGFEISNLIK